MEIGTLYPVVVPQSWSFPQSIVQSFRQRLVRPSRGRNGGGHEKRNGYALHVFWVSDGDRSPTGDGPSTYIVEDPFVKKHRFVDSSAAQKENRVPCPYVHADNKNACFSRFPPDHLCSAHEDP
jgi:hypothetical protein